MIDPTTALLVAGALCALVGVLFWPERGLVPRFLRGARATERVLLEDALKHLHDHESRGLPGTLSSTSGALEISGDRASELLARLVELGLVRLESGRYELTPAGRAEALRVIRVHRLWERYLSDETGLTETEWHRVADRREHTTTPEQAEALAASMGDPLFDPHGAPIPRPTGEIDLPAGLPIMELEPNRLAEIVHIEDEPEAVYAQLVAEGIFVGMKIRLLERTPERCRFEGDDGQEHVLAPVLAANLSAVPLEDADLEEEGPFETLDALAVGERARVLNISPQCRLAERRRMFDLGLLPGTVVEAELRSPSGDPTAYRIRDAVIALRREQAAMIRVERTGEAS